MIAIGRPYYSLDATVHACLGIRSILSEHVDNGRIQGDPASLERIAGQVIWHVARDSGPSWKNVSWHILGMVGSLGRIVLAGHLHEGLRSCLAKVLQGLYDMVQPRIEFTPLPDQYTFILEETFEVIELALQQLEASSWT